MKWLLCCLLIAGIAFSSWAQHQGNHVHGTVLDGNGKGLFSAKVKAPQVNQSVYTDTLGGFYLSSDENFDYLIVTAVGYLQDSIFIGNAGHKEIKIQLNPVKTIGKTTVKGDGLNTHIGRDLAKTEIITHAELKKAACCDLAGCFETQGTVKAVTTNVITNSKELRILGLSGVYNQVLTDGMPMIQGLSYTYGISAMPGPAVYGIFVSKGTNSVLQGYESMVGQINVVPKFGNRSEKLLLNAYVNSFGENQYNVVWGVNKKKWNNFLAVHLVNPAGERDINNDSFMDITRLNRMVLYNKFQFGAEKKKGLEGTIGIKLATEKRVGGQLGYDGDRDKGSATIYGQSINYFQPELYAKGIWKFNDKENIELMASGQYHDQNSYFGPVHYVATQKQGYLNAQYNKDWAQGDNNFKAGASLRSLEIKENINFTTNALGRTYDSSFLKRELIPGIFAENIWNWRGGIFQFITGLRADYHNQFGPQVTPRAMLKYEITEDATLRFSSGTGWRTVNMFAENIGLLSSSRDIVFQETLNPEKSLNMGINYVQNIRKGKWQGYVTTDFYQTRFQNQFFPDYDTDPTKAFIGNFTGRSVSNAFQTDLVMSYDQNIEFKAAYNYLDVYRIVNDKKVLLPFNSKHRIMAAVSLKSNNKKWQGDVNVHWLGKQRLPNTDKNPEAFRQPDFSKAYTTVNIQLTKRWKKVELYGGVENVFDFRQLSPIVNSKNPFDPYFDTSFNWGPTRGREIFMGVRYLPFGVE